MSLFPLETFFYSKFDVNVKTLMRKNNFTKKIVCLYVICSKELFDLHWHKSFLFRISKFGYQIFYILYMRVIGT